MDEQKRTLEKEIKLLEKRYSFLNMFKADDTDGHQRLLETRKTCLLNLIQKQDTLMKLQSEVKVWYNKWCLLSILTFRKWR